MMKHLSILAVSAAAAGLASGHALASLEERPSSLEAAPAPDLGEPVPISWTASTERRASDHYSRAAVSELLRITRTESQALRIGAVEVLGELHHERATAALGVVLYENDDPEVRTAAARVLGEVGTPMAIQALAVAFGDESDAAVRTAQMDAIVAALPEETQALPSGGELVDLNVPVVASAAE